MQGPAPGKEEQDKLDTIGLGSSSVKKSLGAAKPPEPPEHTQAVGFTDRLGLPQSSQPPHTHPPQASELTTLCIPALAKAAAHTPPAEPVLPQSKVLQPPQLPKA